MWQLKWLPLCNRLHRRRNLDPNKQQFHHHLLPKLQQEFPSFP
jgi:hypothetical protein